MLEILYDSSVCGLSGCAQSPRPEVGLVPGLGVATASAFFGLTLLWISYTRRNRSPGEWRRRTEMQRTAAGIGFVVGGIIIATVLLLRDAGAIGP